MTYRSQTQQWLSKLTPETCGQGYYRFFVRRCCLSVIKTTLDNQIERMEKNLLAGFFEKAEDDYQKAVAEIEVALEFFEEKYLKEVPLATGLGSDWKIIKDPNQHIPFEDLK